MPEEIVEGIFRVVLRIVWHFIVEVVIEIAIKVPGHLIASSMSRRAGGPSEIQSFLAGLIFWIALGLIVYLVFFKL